MGLFKRIGDVFKSNINDALSKAEDPEKMLNQTIIDMKEQYAKAKRQVTVAVADEKRLKAQYEKEMKEQESWHKKAQLALQSGREDLAKQAISKRNEAKNLADEYKIPWEKQKQSTEVLKESLRKLDGKIKEAERKKNLLIARQKRAEAQKQIHETMSGITETSAFDTFDRMAEKVDKLEAQAEAAEEMSQLEEGTDLDAEFAQLGSGDVDDDLALLKAEMGLLPESTEKKDEEKKEE